MKRFYSIGLSLALSATILASPETVSAQLLTGKERTDAIREVVTICKDEFKAEKDLGAVSVSDYCSCYARELLNRATARDLENDASPRTKMINVEVTKFCLPTVSKTKR